MADKKISQLTDLTTAADDDSLGILDKDTDVTKRIEVSNLVGTNELLLKTAGTLSSSPQAVQSVGDQVSALQISSVGVKAAGTLTATGDSTLASATLSGDLTIGTGETVDTILDEDDLSSDDPNALATQQSIKAYVDAVPDGTVTSVDVDGGSTGLTTSGGPVTSTGTITIAGTVAETSGGTNQTGYSTGDVLYASASNTLSKLGIGGTGDVLKTSSGGIPEWGAVSGSGTVTSVGVSGGTTGLTTSGGPITASGTVTIAGTLATANGGTGLTAIGDAGQVLTVNSGATGLEYTAVSGSGTVTSVTAGDGMTQSGTSTINPTLDVVGTDDRITANANDIDIASTYVGQTSITTLGTVTTGTWGTGSVIAGTSMTLGSDDTGDVYYRAAGGVLTRLGAGSDADVLTLASGLPSWVTPSGGGNVSNVATPLDNQIAVWTGTTTIEGTANLTFDDSTGALAVTGSAAVDNVTIDGNDISTTDTNGNLTITTNGTGVTEIKGKGTGNDPAIIQLNCEENTHAQKITAQPHSATAANTGTLPPGTTDYTFATTGLTETLTNKTLTSPVLTTPQINDTSADHQYVVAVSELAADRTVTLPLLAGNDEFTFNDHAQTLTNKTLTSPAIDTSIVFDESTNDLTLTASDQTSGAATVDIPDLGGTNGDMVISNATQTLTNKSFDAASAQNTLTNVDLTAAVTGTLPVANGGTGVATIAADSLITGNGTGAVIAEANLIFDATGLAVGTTAANAKLTVDGTAKLKEQSAAAADTAAYGQVWVKDAAPNELWFTDDDGNDKLIDTAELGIACSDEATAITSTGDKATFLVPRAMRLKTVKCNFTTQDSSTDYDLDIKYNASDPTSASSILATGTPNITISSGTYVGSTTEFEDGGGGSQDYYDLAEDSFIVINIATAGTEAKGLKCWLLGWWK